jgi:hypothetical protein
MTRTVEKIVNDVKALPDAELDELLSWLADFEAERMDAWDKTIAADSQPGGRLDGLLARVKDDIARPSSIVRRSNSPSFPRSPSHLGALGGSIRRLAA